MMREVYVLGIGQTIFGKHAKMTCDDLGAYAVNMALKDAEINPKDIETAYCGSLYSPLNPAQSVMLRVGICKIPMYHVENACSSGSSAVHLLFERIALGACEVGIAFGVESLSAFNKKYGKGLLAVEGDMNGKMGLTMPAFFSMLYQRLMSQRGATLEDLCYPTIKNHKNSVNNPLSQYHKELTFEEVMASPTVVDPITVLQCCPQSDGGAAIVLCSAEYYKNHNKKTHRPPVRIAGSVISCSSPEEAGSEPIELPCLIDGAKKACEMAGIGPEDIRVVELHDAFSGEELAAYEMLGLCKKGEGVAFARSGAADIGGRCPVNPSGGLLSMGHPLGASGVRVVNDVTRQLWGEAGATQVQNAKTGMAEMLGGVLTGLENPLVAGIQILSR
ncbi:thiolase family protein [Papillibacter cinnamivorans]|uniref:propanoyl-CoA C-acyltransferase n=1 Tax=Papillibacter cinnamivorans DSM 12816 TaxID=1122930 RepID=A0A1W2CA87_9FIRM|nr:thiolase family protein [Papillibacter cinnamivorans]SMC81792.1 benzoylsuccinyl-CoA thiolase BbsB subunit [Papillibacter cinnamivorans DSM 12816]